MSKSASVRTSTSRRIPCWLDDAPFTDRPLIRIIQLALVAYGQNTDQAMLGQKAVERDIAVLAVGYDQFAYLAFDTPANERMIGKHTNGVAYGGRCIASCARVMLCEKDKRPLQIVERNLSTVLRMARLAKIKLRTPSGERELGGEIAGENFDIDDVIAVEGEGMVQIVHPGILMTLNFFDVVDLDAERARLSMAIAVAEKDRDGLAARLANPAFAERAKPEAVAKAREDHDARAAEAERLGAALKRLG